MWSLNLLVFEVPQSQALIAVLDVTVGMCGRMDIMDDGMAPWIDLVVADANMTELERLIGTLVEGRLEMDFEIQVTGS